MSGVSPVLRRIFLVAPSGGKTDDARDFMRELEGNRKADYRRSERRIGTTKEVWYLARTPAGDQFVADMEIEDFGPVLFSGSQDEFDLWFKRRLADLTSLDLKTRPPARCPSCCPATPHSHPVRVGSKGA
jgi:hypothetical protein